MINDTFHFWIVPSVLRQGPSCCLNDRYNTYWGGTYHSSSFSRFDNGFHKKNIIESIFSWWKWYFLPKICPNNPQLAAEYWFILIITSKEHHYKIYVSIHSLQVKILMLFDIVIFWYFMTHFLPREPRKCAPLTIGG